MKTRATTRVTTSAHEATARAAIAIALLAGVGAGALTLAGCDGCSKKTSGATSSASSSPPSGATSTESAPSDGSLPKECELYLAQLECNMKRTGAAASAESTIASMRTEYMKTAAMPGAGAELAATCKQSSTSMLALLRTSGCVKPQ